MNKYIFSWTVIRMISLTIIVLSLFSEARADEFTASIGTDQYLDVGINSENVNFVTRSSNDFLIAGFSKDINGFDIGLGYGIFEHTFKGSSGFDEKEDREGSIALTIDYQYKPFFIGVVIAKPDHKTIQSRTQRTFVGTIPFCLTTCPPDSFVPVDVFEQTKEIKEVRENDWQIFLFAGLRFTF